MCCGQRGGARRSAVDDLSGHRAGEIRRTELRSFAPAQSPDQSGFAPENFTTLAHFSTSSAKSCPKFAGVIGIGAPPRSARRPFILASASAAAISLLSLSMISSGVFLGAPSPDQTLTSY